MIVQSSADNIAYKKWDGMGAYLYKVAKLTMANYTNPVKD